MERATDYVNAFVDRYAPDQVPYALWFVSYVGNSPIGIVGCLMGAVIFALVLSAYRESGQASAKLTASRREVSAEWHAGDLSYRDVRSDTRRPSPSWGTPYMTVETETKIPLVDLGRMSVRCRSCGAEAMITVTDEKQWRAWTGTQAFKCSVCQTDFGDGVKDAVGCIWRAISSAKASATEIVVRIPMPSRKKKPAPEKPARDLTTDEAITRLFPKPLVDAVEPPEKPGYFNQ